MLQEVVLQEAEAKKEKIKQKKMAEQALLAQNDPVAAYCNDDMSLELSDAEFIELFKNDIPSAPSAEELAAAAEDPAVVESSALSQTESSSDTLDAQIAKVLGFWVPNKLQS